MIRRLRTALFAVLLLSAAQATGGSRTDKLAAELQGGGDFRVKVSAALSLGKSGDAAALRPLYQALRDKSAAVRAAAAAALSELEDPAAISALERCSADASPAVRREVARALAHLKREASEDVARRRGARVLVKLGSVRNGSTVKSTEAELTVQVASRDHLEDLPGVALLKISEDVEKVATDGGVPVVLLTGNIRELAAVKEGAEMVYSARVEYVVQRMPEHSILGKVSGKASARASQIELKDRGRREELRSAVLDAAVQSAMQRAPTALLAASR